MKNSEIKLRQKKLLEEVFFLKQKHTQNERNKSVIESDKSKD